MAINKEVVLSSARSAGTSALIVIGAAFANSLVRWLINGLFDKRWYWNWGLTASLAGSLGGPFFVVMWIHFLFKQSRSSEVTSVLEETPSPGKNDPIIFSGFVAMEYYWLIMNRTFVVYVGREGLYGWKVLGPVTANDPNFFLPLEELASDEEMVRDRHAVKKLSELKGGFWIPRSSIAAVEPSDRSKWGMASIPHSGRIRLRLADGGSRELILLGSVSPERIAAQILQG